MTDARDIVERLRGIYRTPIVDGLRAAGGDEPDNADYFVRTFEVSPIQIEAANEIASLRKQLENAREALTKLLNYMPEHDDWCSIGALHNCTCNSRPLKEEARQALKGQP